MGIRYLNKYMREKCSSIKPIHLSALRNKAIAVDISIYMYKFLADNALLENMYLLISIFRKYNIKPVFIFDGKPPQQKTDTLEERKAVRKQAFKEFQELKNSLDLVDEEHRQEIVEQMDSLKKKFIRVTNEHIEKVKALMDSYGVCYCTAPGEADELCVKMVQKNKVYACLSEDMDMFVYGCNRVLRYLSLVNHNAIIYDLKEILKELDINLFEFREICVASGTDYNPNKKICLFKTLKYFNKFKKTNEKNFYEWLEKNTDYVENIYDLYSIINMFELTNYDFKNYENINVNYNKIEKDSLVEILSQENFIFV